MTKKDLRELGTCLFTDGATPSNASLATAPIPARRPTPPPAPSALVLRTTIQRCPICSKPFPSSEGVFVYTPQRDGKATYTLTKYPGGSYDKLPRRVQAIEAPGTICTHCFLRVQH